MGMLVPMAVWAGMAIVAFAMIGVPGLVIVGAGAACDMACDAAIKRAMR